jgi:hypothetical protein
MKTLFTTFSLAIMVLLPEKYPERDALTKPAFSLSVAFAMMKFPSASV